MLYADIDRCIDACIRCAREAQYCAENCQVVDGCRMEECIRLTTDCAGICRTAIEFMCRESSFAGEICHICADICDLCAIECQQHDAEHCHQCAQACRDCAEQCRRVAAVITIEHVR